MALDHWVYVADGLGDTTSMTRLLGLARRARSGSAVGRPLSLARHWRDNERCDAWRPRCRQAWTEKDPRTDRRPRWSALLAKKLGQKDEQAEPLLRAAQVRHPEDFWLNYGLGEALRERKPAEAVGFYRAALATRPTVAPVHMEISVALLRQGQANEAILASRKAVELDPKDGRFHFHLGVCLHDGGRFTEAIVEFRRSIELDPKSAPFHLGMGLCLQAMGRIEEAMGEFRRSIELDPKLAASYHHIGSVCRPWAGSMKRWASSAAVSSSTPKDARCHLRDGHVLAGHGPVRRSVGRVPPQYRTRSRIGRVLPSRRQVFAGHGPDR